MAATALVVFGPNIAFALRTDSVSEIDSFCGGLAPFTKKSTPRRFGLYSKDEYDSGTWREYRDTKALRRDVDGFHVVDVAEVWIRPDRSAAISRTFSSESGDWTEFVEYCFRPDGTLAKVSATLNTFNATSEQDPRVDGAHREQLRYFSSSGVLLKESKTVVDLRRKKKVLDIQYMERHDEEPVAMSLSALPFAGLVGP